MIGCDLMKLQIIDKQFNLYGEIDNFQGFAPELKWHGVGAFTLTISEDVLYANELMEDRIIFDDPKKPFLITDRGNAFDSNGNQLQGMIEIKGYQLKWLLDSRNIIPPPTTSHDRITSNAEAIMKHYVNNHVLNPANTKRAMTLLAMGANQNRGDSFSWEARYKPLIGELTAVSQASGLGWNVTIDAQNQKFLFEVYEGLNLIQSQNVNPPVIFTTQLDNVIAEQFNKSIGNFKNFAYVAGTGEGETRKVIEAWSTDSEPTGMDRKEIFIDARDLSQTNDDNTIKTDAEYEAIMKARGKQKLLTDYSPILSFTTTVKEKEGMLYGVDWNLGDMVSAQETKWGIVMDARIIAVKEIYQNNTRQLETTFGTNVPTFLDAINNDLSQLKNMIRN